MIAICASAGYAQSVSVGQNVLRLRMLAGITTQTELAKRMGIPTPRAHDLESDRYDLPQTKTLIKAAQAIGCSVDALLDGAGGYKSPILHHGTDSAKSAEPGGPAADVAQARRIEKLEKDNERLRRTIAEIQRIATSLAKVVADREKGARTRRGTTGRR